ncbi:hypothetical protein BGX31_002048 [Mortierella sp. GBA43]|nr:hypothetical protein BGX31_002048 [Mortierella sp. GBA43]
MDSSPIAHQLSEEPRSEADEPGCQNEQEDEQIGSPAQLIGQLGVANEQREDQNEGEVPTPEDLDKPTEIKQAEEQMRQGKEMEQPAGGQTEEQISQVEEKEQPVGEQAEASDHAEKAEVVGEKNDEQINDEDEKAGKTKDM